MTLLEQREKAWDECWEFYVQFNNHTEDCKDLKKAEQPTYWPTLKHRIKEQDKHREAWLKWLDLNGQCYNASLPGMDWQKMFRGHVKTEVPAKQGKRIKQIWMKPQ